MAPKVAPKPKQAWDGDGVPLEESNCDGLGSVKDKALRKKAAQTETAWAGAGAGVGLMIWRVENFKVVAWPKESYGKFYKGDSYIVLETVKDNDSAELHHHIFFWLGEFSSLDEKGTAAYKTVELSDLLEDGPHQSREVMDQESKHFRAMFPKLILMEGGMESGFHHVELDKFKPKLVHVHKVKNRAHSKEVKVTRDSMNQGDCFILDIGSKIWKWEGDEAAPIVKFEATMLAEHLKTERPHGHATIMPEPDDEFWGFLGGKAVIKSKEEAEMHAADETAARTALFDIVDADHSGGISRAEWDKAFDVIDANADGCISRKEWFIKHGTACLYDFIPKNVVANISRDEWSQSFDTFDFDHDGTITMDEWTAKVPKPVVDEKEEKEMGDGVLLKLSDTHTDVLKVDVVARDRFSKEMLDSNHVMMLDHETEICLWVGKQAPTIESRNAFRTALKYLDKDPSRDPNIPIHLYKEGTDIRNPVWCEAFQFSGRRLSAST